MKEDSESPKLWPIKLVVLVLMMTVAVIASYVERNAPMRPLPAAVPMNLNRP